MPGRLPARRARPGFDRPCAPNLDWVAGKNPSPAFAERSLRSRLRRAGSAVAERSLRSRLRQTLATLAASAGRLRLRRGRLRLRRGADFFIHCAHASATEAAGITDVG